MTTPCYLSFRALLGMLLVILMSACCKTDEIPQYTRKLYSSSAHDRNEAALALAKCSSPEADRAVGRLSELLYDANVGVQSSAAYALRKIDSAAARKALEAATKKR